jgi:intraflagellar transport protein 20
MSFGNTRRGGDFGQTQGRGGGGDQQQQGGRYEDNPTGGRVGGQQQQQGGQKQVLISFDEQNRLRILDADQFRSTAQLAEECVSFTTKIDEFSECVDGLVDILTVQSKQIEREKLMAIGQRNRIDSEQEIRKRRERELKSSIHQMQQELQREKDHYASLVKVEADQRSLMDTLVHNE